ncbi:MAG TPA: N-acetylglucosamine-6-phosphate deacetylase [Chitinophagaceae bacterium]|jgi:N-acetylglucosamine-6-phosphate deacetylase|nr:N-acetylglucosamine-6-phosphate deacetylase [Chitinophagaceae bacterium]
MKQAYLADGVFTGTGTLQEQVVLTEDHQITGILPAKSLPSGYDVTSYPGCWIVPAFIDLQIYGGNGKLFSHSLDIASLDATYDYCVSGGCSRFMITMATNSMENFFKGIETAGVYMASGKKGLLGLHLEGPWISPAKKGAHLEAFIKKPTRDEVMLLLEKGKGIVKMITLAPEQCDDEIIQLLLDHGIIVSAGHSNAAYSRAKQTFQMGIPAATHLFNAMSPLQGREPGMVGAIYDDPKVMSSIICDGVHVDFASVRISKKIMGERLFFITDAVSTIREGYYQHIFKGDRYTVPDGTLSGSCMTMISTCRNAVQKAGIPLEESLKMCSAYPAALLKDPFLGKIQAGQYANFNIINLQNLELVHSVFY